MEVAARLNGAPLSAQKARLVADMIRRRPVGQALEILKHSPKRASKVIRKVLLSALANAEHNEALDVDELVISTIHVDQGPSLKRMRPRAKGRGCRIIKQTSHITVKVSENEE